MMKRKRLFEFRFQGVDAVMLNCGEILRREGGVVDASMVSTEMHHKSLLLE
jgi:hypothetical protein